MFIVRTYFRDQELSSVENAPVELLAEIIRDGLIQMSEDPRFSMKIEVEPRAIRPCPIEIDPELPARSRMGLLQTGRIIPIEG